MKKLVSFGLVSLTVLGLGASVSNAAPVTIDSTGDVKFITDDDPLNPKEPGVVDPTDPNEKEVPVIPGEDPEKEGSGGVGTKSFGINWVSNFKFGEVKISSLDMNKYAAPTVLNLAEVDENGNTVLDGDGNPVPSGETRTVANFIQIRDARGTRAGWHVTVSGTEFREYDPAAKDFVTDGEVLAGAQIFLQDPEVIGSGSDVVPVADLAGTQDILSVADSPYTVLKAAEGTGNGTWGVYWGAVGTANAEVTETYTTAPELKTADAGVKLTVPVSANPSANKTYRSELTWTLNDTPEV